MAGQGGGLCTNNLKFFQKAVSLSQHGIDKSKTENIIGQKKLDLIIDGPIFKQL